MKVLVVGSTRGLETDIDIRGFESACEKLGLELARAGHELILGSNRPSTADHWIALGANRFSERRTQITIYGPDDRRAKFDPKFYSNLDLKLQSVEETWTRLRPRQVELADVVILIGGSRGTRQAGLHALEMNKLVLPIATFGGAAEEIWIEMRSLLRRAPVLRTRLTELQFSWSDKVATELIKNLEAVDKEMSSQTEPEHFTTALSIRNLERKYWTSFDGIKRIYIFATTQPLILFLVISGLICAALLFMFSIHVLLANAAMPEMTLAIVGQAVAAGIEQGNGGPQFDNNTKLAFFAILLAIILIIGILLVIFSKNDDRAKFGMHLITSILGFVTGSITTLFGL